MSLDVYLKGPEETRRCECSCCGNEHEYTASPTLYFVPFVEDYLVACEANPYAMVKVSR